MTQLVQELSIEQYTWYCPSTDHMFCPSTPIMSHRYFKSSGAGDPWLVKLKSRPLVPGIGVSHGIKSRTQVMSGKEHVRSSGASLDVSQHHQLQRLSLALVFAQFRANIKHCAPRVAHSALMSHHVKSRGLGEKGQILVNRYKKSDLIILCCVF